ncbi:Cd(II)/Pb(II)-responsive transcriptional regulator [Piscinibacter koreensis]|uniref:Cd(II)/Pb(II)-responsive transcriptional regulator n=1 Tax=Piscinibacter koreensis TaxID=2742824 RepID=A0A7Y6TYR7_9BURK|nr:Cd(II)/Pb(II)-responsive transcriptional regulator [Schlegelella koreensis]
MKIGELSKASGTAIETIRFYEREGLLAAPARTEGNYRIYGDAHAERLAFVRHCRSLDMTLDKIRALLRFKDSPAENCGEVNALLDAQIGHVADRIRDLRALEKQLNSLRQQCLDLQGKDCGVLQALVKDARSSNRSNPKRQHVQGAHG